jgi:hypothetical protein
MKIIYLINNTYQVVSKDEQIIYFQGSKEDCMRYLLEQELIKNGIIYTTRTMKEKTLAIIVMFLVLGMIALVGTAIVSQIFKGSF